MMTSIYWLLFIITFVGIWAYIIIADKSKIVRNAPTWDRFIFSGEVIVPILILSLVISLLWYIFIPVLGFCFCMLSLYEKLVHGECKTFNNFKDKIYDYLQDW